jgi:hypothetical protein
MTTAIREAHLRRTQADRQAATAKAKRFLRQREKPYKRVGA